MLVHDLVPPAPGKPLCLVLHGLGDSKEGWKPVAPALDLAGWGWCFVQAPNAYGPGWSWFDLDLERMRADPRQVTASHRALLELLAHLERGGIPCERIAVMGFSQGCLMALELALRHPRHFLAVVAISGWLHRTEDWPAAFGAALARQRLLVTHGRWDGVVPVELARPRIEHLRGLGVALAWAEYDKDHGLDPAEEIGDIRRHLLDAERAAADGPAPGEQA